MPDQTPPRVPDGFGADASRSQKAYLDAEAQIHIAHDREDARDRSMREHNDSMRRRFTGFGLALTIVTIAVSAWAARNLRVRHSRWFTNPHSQPLFSGAFCG